MRFTLQTNSRQQIFVPYKTPEHLSYQYYLLFTKEVNRGTDIWVMTNEEIKVNSMFFIGDMFMKEYKGDLCGHIFWTRQKSVCTGTSIYAYSNIWAKTVNEGRFPLEPFGVELSFKHDDFYIYHKDNAATLIVNPSIAQNIRGNLEV